MLARARKMTRFGVVHRPPVLVLLRRTLTATSALHPAVEGRCIKLVQLGQLQLVYIQVGLDQTSPADHRDVYCNLIGTESNK